jgi:hypothetical protein
VDVLFSPSGSVITPNLTQNIVALWVRMPDTTQPNPSSSTSVLVGGNPPAGNPSNAFMGTPTIIAVMQTTGLVAAYPPVSGNNPYSDIK